MPTTLTLKPQGACRLGPPRAARQTALRPRTIAAATAMALVCASWGMACANEPARPAAAAPSEPKSPSELDALDLADKAAEPAKPAPTAQGAPWRAFVEAGAGRSSLRSGAPDVNTRRLSADLRYDQRWAPALRAVLSNRLDLADSDATPPARNVNTLREAYLSWTPAPATVLDLGRVNVPLGSAMGYNPTDFFKSGALRSVVSADPAVLRENRQGTVVLRAQHLWDGGSLSGLATPKLASRPDPGRYALDAGSTNPRDRWLLAGSHRVSDRFSPQWLLQGGEGQSTQLGLNLSALAGEATTVYAEAATGRGPTLLDQAFSTRGDGRRRQRAALGLTHTTAFKLVLTLEAQANSAAPTQAQWRALSGEQRLAVLTVADREQDLVSRRAWFAHAQWKDVVVSRLDLAGYWRNDAETGGNEHWLELRYRGTQWEVALQWQRFGGNDASWLAAAPLRTLTELVARVYF